MRELEQERFFQSVDRLSKLHKAMSSLSRRQQAVIMLRFGWYKGEELTLREIGEVFQLSYEAVRQLELQALIKLKHPSRGLKKLWDEL